MVWRDVLLKKLRVIQLPEESAHLLCMSTVCHRIHKRPSLVSTLNKIKLFYPFRIYSFRAYPVLSFNLPSGTFLHVLCPIFFLQCSSLACEVLVPSHFTPYSNIWLVSAYIWREVCVMNILIVQHFSSVLSLPPCEVQMFLLASLSHTPHSLFVLFMRHTELQPTCCDFCICKCGPLREAVQSLGDVCHGFLDLSAGSAAFGLHQVQCRLLQDSDERTEWPANVQQWSQLRTCEYSFWHGDDCKRLVSSGMWRRVVS
jgi:hypothetical protein